MEGGLGLVLGTGAVFFEERYSAGSQPPGEDTTEQRGEKLSRGENKVSPCRPLDPVVVQAGESLDFPICEFLLLFELTILLLATKSILSNAHCSSMPWRLVTLFSIPCLRMGPLGFVWLSDQL